MSGVRGRERFKMAPEFMLSFEDQVSSPQVELLLPQGNLKSALKVFQLIELFGLKINWL